MSAQSAKPNQPLPRRLEAGRESTAAIRVKAVRREPVGIATGPAHDLKGSALRWVVWASRALTGYLADLSVARAQNWREFPLRHGSLWVPSENIVYADVDGNIGWQAAGMAPIRPNWSGLLPVPGDTGEYEWSGFRKAGDLPRLYHPPQHFIATANHNILPSGYKVPLGYEWALPFRYLRIREMLTGAGNSAYRFERMQRDVHRCLRGGCRRW
jgi:penicillin amidase